MKTSISGTTGSGVEHNRSGHRPITCPQGQEAIMTTESGDLRFHELTEKVIAIVNKYRAELRAEGVSDADIEAAIQQARFESAFGIRVEDSDAAAGK